MQRCARDLVLGLDSLPLAVERRSPCRTGWPLASPSLLSSLARCLSLTAMNPRRDLTRLTLSRFSALYPAASQSPAIDAVDVCRIFRTHQLSLTRRRKLSLLNSPVLGPALLHKALPRSHPVLGGPSGVSVAVPRRMLS